MAIFLRLRSNRARITRMVYVKKNEVQVSPSMSSHAVKSRKREPKLDEKEDSYGTSLYHTYTNIHIRIHMHTDIHVHIHKFFYIRRDLAFSCDKLEFQY